MKCSELLRGCVVTSESFRENRWEQGKKAREGCQEMFGTLLSGSRKYNNLMISEPGSYKTR